MNKVICIFSSRRIVRNISIYDWVSEKAQDARLWLCFFIFWGVFFAHKQKYSDSVKDERQKDAPSIPQIFSKSTQIAGMGCTHIFVIPCLCTTSMVWVNGWVNEWYPRWKHIEYSPITAWNFIYSAFHLNWNLNPYTVVIRVDWNHRHYEAQNHFAFFVFHYLLSRQHK